MRMKVFFNEYCRNILPEQLHLEKGNELVIHRQRGRGNEND
jgi:hypothetical protein